MEKRKSFLLPLILVLILLLRLPSLFEPYWYGDEGIYFAVAETLKRGGILYRDTMDNKTPLIYYLFTLLKTQFWVRTVALLWILSNTVFLYFLGRTLFGKKGAIFSSLVFGLLSSLPLLEGNIANGELFFILPSTIGFFFIANGQFLNFSISQFLLSGFFFAIAFLFKVPALADLGAVIVFLFLTQLSFKKFLKKSSSLMLGFLATVLPFVVYFTLRGCLQEFLAASFFNNLSYTAAWGGGTFSTRTLLFLKSFLLFFLPLLLLIFRRKVNLTTLLIYPWLFLSFFGATISNRPYPHYLMQTVPAFSLLLGKSISQKRKLLDLILAFLAILLALNLFNLSFLNFKYQVAYFQNFRDFVFKQKSSRDYLAFFDPITPRNYKIANFLRKTTKDSDKIFIWGDQALIYALSERAAAGRFVTAHHINDIKGAKEETIIALKKDRPKYILIDTQTKFPFPELFNILGKDYNKKAQFGEIEVYQRTNEV